MNIWSEKPVKVHIMVVGTRGSVNRSIVFPKARLKHFISVNSYSFAAINRNNAEQLSESIIEIMNPFIPMPSLEINMMLNIKREIVANMPSIANSFTMLRALTKCEHSALKADANT